MAWESLTDGFFKGQQFHTATPSRDKSFGVSSQKTDKERRLQLIRYPQKDGGKVNDFGANQDVVTLDIIFFGSGYLEKYTSFLKACNDGEPGILVVPIREKAIVAYFQKVSEVTEVGSGGTIKGTFTFVEDTTIDPIDLSAPGSSQVVNIDEKASALAAKVEDAKSALKNNSFLDAIRSSEGGISSVRRYSGATLALDQAVKSRFASISDRISGTLGLLGSAMGVFRKPNLTVSLTNGNSAGITSSKNVIDKETGQEVVPFDRDSSVEVEPDPLEESVESTINEENTPEISGNNLNSNAGIEVFTDKVSELIKEQREELSQLGGGRTDDVTRSLTQVILALDDFKKNIVKPKGEPVVVPREYSVMEILFHNEIDLDQMEDVIRTNFHIDDPLAVPAGSVVYL